LLAEKAGEWWCESREQRRESEGQRAEKRERRAESRGVKRAEKRERRAESRGEKTESRVPFSAGLGEPPLHTQV
jgi:hypothetical protein